MMFKPFDGFFAPLMTEVRPTDAAITVRMKAAAALMTMAPGDWTYLTLNDSTSMEIVKVMGGFQVRPGERCPTVDVPVIRGIQGIAQNFGPTAYAAYKVVTPVVEDLIAEMIPKTAPTGTIGDIGQECVPGPNGPSRLGPQGALSPTGAIGPHGA